jgi:GntR family transcriptional repressor for pyruvate dehydrogenase complex
MADRRTRSAVVATDGPPSAGSPTSRFEPVQRRTVPEAIRFQIEKGLDGGVFAPDAPLPTLRELSEQFGASRAAVREAMQGLLATGHVRRRGTRLYAVEHLPAINQRDLQGERNRIRQLFEVRRLIELPMVELAVQRATREDREELRAIAVRFDKNLEFATFRALDRDFHWCLAGLTHNPLLTEVYRKVLDALFESQEWNKLLHETLDNRARRAIVAASGREHRAIADAVLRGSREAASRCVAQHLETVETHLVERLSESEELQSDAPLVPTGPTRRE